MATRLTPFSRLLIVLLILTGVVFGGRYLLNKTGIGDKLKQDAESSSNGSSSKDSDDDVLNVQLFTFGNAAPGIYYNGGLEPSENSRFWKEQGIKVKFNIIDDFDGSRQAFKSGAVQLFNNEVSAMAPEMEGLAPFNPQIVMQLDWSRGADAVVAKRGINSINDLKGKKIAYTPASPSQTLLLFMLEAAGLKVSDVVPLEVTSAGDAETAFKSGQVDAAVVWDPNPSLEAVPGSKVLESTLNASHIIADVFMGKKEWVEKNKDKLAKFYKGWMTAVGEMNADPQAKNKAIDLMAQNLKLSKDVALGMVDALKLANHGDNKNFFGLNPEYKGITGEQLYAKMGNMYQSLGLAPANRPNWRALNGSYAVSMTDLTGNGQEGEGTINFSPATVKEKSMAAKSTKPISITFPTAQFALDENAKTLIDLQFADVAKGFANSRIRIEGNTDNVGSKQNNLELSRKRAQSVATYLQTTYDIDPDRFIIVGNGMEKPVAGCQTNATEACKAKNRRTDFQLISE